MSIAAIEKLLSRFPINRDDLLDGYRESRRRFETFAAMDAPDLPADPHDALQVKLARWQSRNFGPAPAHLLTLGVVEEVGELVVAVEAMDSDAIDDALGDIGIYCAQLATARRLAIATPLTRADRPTGSMKSSQWMIVGASLAAHVALKESQGIRGIDGEVARIGTYAALAMIGVGYSGLGIEAFTCMGRTAEHVMRRDWSKNPTNADEVQP